MESARVVACLDIVIFDLILTYLQLLKAFLFLTVRHVTNRFSTKWPPSPTGKVAYLYEIGWVICVKTLAG